MVPEEHAVRSGVFGVRDVALALGLTPRQLKNAISAGALPAPDPAIPSLPFALAAFDEAWMDRARLALAADPQTVREAPYKPRRQGSRSRSDQGAGPPASSGRLG